MLWFYWDDEEHRSIEVPVGDFFGMGWGEYTHLNSLVVSANPGRAFNSYWQMPFRKKCRCSENCFFILKSMMYCYGAGDVFIGS
ncbi:DUF2961 domain-containing protein [Splendidivirga corallicola]|uniref:DUF2961 domain-containing protein n=1 Tax=Splendidivirga corallicola TaxID=3051826 RepID=UPI003D29251E